MNGDYYEKKDTQFNGGDFDDYKLPGSAFSDGKRCKSRR